MTKPTGRPPGRPLGTRNKRTVAGIEAGAKAVQAALADVPEAFNGDAHAYLQTIYRDPMHPVPMRLAAATASIRFEKPALQAIDHTTLGDKIVRDVSDKPMSDEEWMQTHGQPH